MNECDDDLTYRENLFQPLSTLVTSIAICVINSWLFANSPLQNCGVLKINFTTDLKSSRSCNYNYTQQLIANWPGGGGGGQSGKRGVYGDKC